MRKYKIEPKRVKMIHPKVGKAPNIVLIEGQRDGEPIWSGKRHYMSMMKMENILKK